MLVLFRSQLYIGISIISNALTINCSLMLQNVVSKVRILHRCWKRVLFEKITFVGKDIDSLLLKLESDHGKFSSAKMKENQ